MRIIFMGTTPFSCVVLKQLIDDNYNVVGVVTQPDRPFGRKKILKPSAVKVLALEYGITVVQPEKIRSDYEAILAMKPDCIITCAYGQIVPKVILDAPTYKCLNVHASLLPNYRGGAPIHKAIIDGQTQTGVTLMHMDVGMDSGDMLATESVSIAFTDTFGDVEEKLMEASRALIHHALPLYFDGKLQAQKQDETRVTYAYTLKREDEFVSFQKPIDEVYNHIRGMIPWPTSYGVLEGSNVKFHGVKYLDENHDLPYGTILDIDEHGVYVAANGGVLLMTSVQPAGKSKLSNLDLINGYRNQWKGKCFE